MSALRHVRGAPACGSGTAGVLVQYAEEPKGHPLGGSHNAVGAQRTLDDCGTAVDNLCIIPANILYPLVAFLLKTVISDSCFPHQLNLNLICRVDSRMGLEEAC